MFDSNLVQNVFFLPNRREYGNNYDERLNGKRECSVVARDETEF
jgi:hypothetical protein